MNKLLCWMGFHKWTWGEDYEIKCPRCGKGDRIVTEESDPNLLTKCMESDAGWADENGKMEIR